MAAQFLIPGYGQFQEPEVSAQILLPGYGQAMAVGGEALEFVSPQNLTVLVSLSAPGISEAGGGTTAHSMFLLL